MAKIINLPSAASQPVANPRRHGRQGAPKVSNIKTARRLRKFSEPEASDAGLSQDFTCGVLAGSRVTIAEVERSLLQLLWQLRR